MQRTISVEAEPPPKAPRDMVLIQVSTERRKTGLAYDLVNHPTNRVLITRNVKFEMDGTQHD